MLNKIFSKISLTLAVLLVVTVIFNCSKGGPRDLVINTDTSDPAPKQAFSEVIEDFKKENPNINVIWNVFDHESYKTSIRSFLDAEPADVVSWYAGNRMNFFVEKGLFEDVSDVWEDNGMYDTFKSTRDSMSVDGKQFGVPYTFYQWGVYYRKDIFEANGISVPKTFDELLEAGKTLRATGIAPVTIGTKFLWTTAGWFDYLNLRTHGLKFHIDLMLGKIPYTDDRVRETFANWRKLVDANFYIKDHTSYSWQEAQPFLYRGEAAMYLIGNFITPNFPEDIKDKMGFFQFPVINPEVGMAEDAPTDTMHIPAKAKNKEDAKKFLSYLASKEVQEKINKILKQIPTHSEAAPLDDPFLNEGVKMLASADGTAQFYDRDTSPDMAKTGMQGFQEFMVNPDNLDSILEKLEKTRKRVFEE